MPSANPRFPEEQPPDRTISCPDIDEALSHYLSELGYRLVMIFPADNPRTAIVEKDGSHVRLEAEFVREVAEPAAPEDRFSLSRADDEGVWHEGRAGMLYRDLIPSRLGGRLIASHIKIPKGGPVPDYVHFHQVDFQVICCIAGNGRLVYEDQGEPFLFESGDCVLQPPGIRHRVLECSDGFEVVELSSPAEHPTFAEHDLELPTKKTDPDREFEGQRFRHSRSNDGVWKTKAGGIEVRETGLYGASGGSVDALWIRCSDPRGGIIATKSEGATFLFCTFGASVLASGEESAKLRAGDAVLVSGNEPLGLTDPQGPARFLLFRF
jgi:quercetin dioxygenase-like cupin family protein